jgi:hypothetical protein
MQPQHLRYSAAIGKLHARAALTPGSSSRTHGGSQSVFGNGKTGPRQGLELRSVQPLTSSPLEA